MNIFKLYFKIRQDMKELKFFQKEMVNLKFMLDKNEAKVDTSFYDSINVLNERLDRIGNPYRKSKISKIKNLLTDYKNLSAEVRTFLHTNSKTQN
jgi:cell fate (sporulation/competence/biofilm development) regulator YmcA (YheA/YmcA/DUF963 family)